MPSNKKKMKIEADQVKNEEIAILFLDPLKMSESYREVWKNRCEEIKLKYNM